MLVPCIASFSLLQLMGGKNNQRFVVEAKE
jgi:hypothetical protein